MSLQATTTEAYELLHEGTLALGCVEEWGMRVDVGLLDKTEADTTRQIDELDNSLKNSDVWRLWKRRFGEKANIGSGPQLADILMDDLGFQIEARTEKSNKVKVDEKSLSGVDHPFIKDYFRQKKLKKLRDTYLSNIRRELVGEYLHANINLHLVNSYRSSADRPNVQNQIRRDAEFAEMLRRMFIPSPGHVLVEADMSAHEFRIGACVCLDGSMLDYAGDPTKDVHRDMASECYDIPLQSDWKNPNLKKVRGEAKNKFVFPTFYGSYYVSTAKNLWSAIELEELKTDRGNSLYEHLASRGIKKLGACDPKQKPTKGTFEHHVQQVDRAFHDRFPDWSDYQESTMRDYQKSGYFDMLTGFRCAGVFSRNQVLNFKVQGPAFHIVLWDLIQLVKWIRKNRMKTRVICEIHDSIISDVHLSELDDYLAKMKQVMTQDVKKHWRWIVVPLDIEVDRCDESWFGKKRVDI